jgi:hypothetical protein
MTPEGSHVYRIISPGSNRTIKYFCRQVHDGILEKLCRQVHSILGIRRINNTRWFFFMDFKDTSIANIEESLLSDALKACNSGI